MCSYGYWLIYEPTGKNGDNLGLTKAADFLRGAKFCNVCDLSIIFFVNFYHFFVILANADAISTFSATYFCKYYLK